MITVNDNIYKTYGGIEGYKKHLASHDTYNYIEDRLAFSDLLEHSILIDMLLHLHDDIIPEQVIKGIYDEISKQPISNDTPSKIRQKVDKVIIENQEVIDEFARQEIDRILDIIDVIFDLLNSYNDRIVQNEQKLSSMTRNIVELNNSIIDLQSSLEDIIQHNNDIERTNKRLQQQINDLKLSNIEQNNIINNLKQSNKRLQQQVNKFEKELETLEEKYKELEQQIEILLKRDTPQIIINSQKKQCKPKPKNICDCNLGERYRPIFGMVI